MRDTKRLTWWRIMESTPEGHCGSGLVFCTSGGAGGRSFLAGLGALSCGSLSISGGLLGGVGASFASSTVGPRSSSLRSGAFSKYPTDQTSLPGSATRVSSMVSKERDVPTVDVPGMSLESSKPMRWSSRLIILFGSCMSSATGICTRPTRSLGSHQRWLRPNTMGP
jgi:hypothetical protein